MALTEETEVHNILSFVKSHVDWTGIQPRPPCVKACDKLPELWHD
jgi:hypothetical protein